MEPKLIHIARISNIATEFPVYYFGAPDNKIYLVYSQLHGKSGYTYKIGLVMDKEYVYNYQAHLFQVISGKRIVKFFAEMHLNGHHKRIKFLDSGRFGINNLTENTARQLLNKLINPPPKTSA